MKIPKIPNEYGMLIVLVVLCLVLSVVTIERQDPVDESAAFALAATIKSNTSEGDHILIVARNNSEEASFAESVTQALKASGREVVGTANSPPDARDILETSAREEPIKAVALTGFFSEAPMFKNLGNIDDALSDSKSYSPERYWWPNFLKAANLRNVANQIAVTAILAVGMTAVIVTAGIDLSVGSLIGFATVVSTLLIRDFAGGEQASAVGVIACCGVALILCAAFGAFTGSMVTVFTLPPFIVTLALMLSARGIAGWLAGNQTISQVPESFSWLGSQTTLSLPNAVWLMGGIYVVAHIVMSRTVWGRYIYAVGGNPEAARLSGVPNGWVLISVYTMCGFLAGLGGIVMASQLDSGKATFGTTMELYVIAAVVIGGTSLFGGKGTVLGTLIGAFIIAVIRNGMNLMGIDSNIQELVFGLVILSAALIDRLKNEGLPPALRGLFKGHSS